MDIEILEANRHLNKIELNNLKPYVGQRLSNNLVISIKIDGVRAVFKDGVWLSRANKPLYNLPLNVPEGTYEVFLGNFDKTISAVRTMVGEQVHPSSLYMLLPKLDERLILDPFTSVEDHFKDILQKGFEGLVVYDQTYCTSYKFKQKLTEDVIIRDIFEGKGKFVGMLGGFITDKGNVGTGFTTEQRKEFFTDKNIGRLIEVSFMEYTKDNKFRHPVFTKFREDLQ